jgi:hypothetical protein
VKIIKGDSAAYSTMGIFYLIFLLYDPTTQNMGQTKKFKNLKIPLTHPFCIFFRKEKEKKKKLGVIST